uniref:C2H2-type domain-containing protein n=1 Tax=Glossina morsitans morsitans TaxID=37546 RepID=A0A1B0FIJ6_GLOMM
MLTNVVVKNEPLDNNFEDMIAQQSNTKQEFIFDMANIKEELDEGGDISTDELNNLWAEEKRGVIIDINTDDLRLHTQLKQTKFIESSESINDGKAERYCSVCSFAVTENQKSLLDHLNLHRDNYFFCMLHCGFSSTNLENCLSHEIREHNYYWHPKSRTNEPKAGFHCSFCRGGFNSELQLHVHWLVSKQSCSKLMQKVAQQVNVVLAIQSKSQVKFSNALSSVPTTKLRLKSEPLSRCYVNKRRASVEDISEPAHTLVNKRSKAMENTDVEIKKEPLEEFGDEYFTTPLPIIPEVIIKTELDLKEDIKEEADDNCDEVDFSKEQDKETVTKSINLQTTSSIIPALNSLENDGVSPKIIPNTNSTVIKPLANFKLIKLSPANAMNENASRALPLLSSQLKTNANVNNNNNVVVPNANKPLRLISIPLSCVKVTTPTTALNENINRAPPPLTMQLKSNVNVNNNIASIPSSSLRIVSIPPNEEKITTPAPAINENINGAPSLLHMQLKTNANVNNNIVSIPSSSLRMVSIPPKQVINEKTSKVPCLVPMKLKTNASVNNECTSTPARLVSVPLNNMQIIKLPTGTQVTKLNQPVLNTNLPLIKQTDMKKSPLLLRFYPLKGIQTIPTTTTMSSVTPPPLLFNANLMNTQEKVEANCVNKPTTIDVEGLKRLPVQTPTKVECLRKNVVISKERLKALESIPEKKQLIDHFIKQIEQVEQKQTEQKSSGTPKLRTDSNNDKVQRLAVNTSSATLNGTSNPPSVFVSIITSPNLELMEARRQYPDYHYRLVCPYCQKDYELKAGLRLHLLNTHSLKHKDLHKICVQAKPFKTTILLKSLENYPEKVKSSKRKTEDLTGNIPDANKTLVNPLDFPDNATKAPSPPPSVANVAPITFSALNMHKTRYVCNKCGRTCSSKSMLHDHVLANCSRVPRYSCSQCPKKFYSSGTLHCHLSIHTGELPHKCHYCDKRFRTKGQVTVHHRTHTGEKPFVCEVCSLRFTHRETLIAHLSRHIGMKRYKCYGCDELFLCISALKTHRNTRSDSCGKIKFNPRAVGPRVRVVRGNVMFEPQPEINPYLRSEDPKNVLAELKNHQSPSLALQRN